MALIIDHAQIGWQAEMPVVECLARMELKQSPGTLFRKNDFQKGLQTGKCLFGKKISRNNTRILSWTTNASKEDLDTHTRVFPRRLCSWETSKRKVVSQARSPARKALDGNSQRKENIQMGQRFIERASCSMAVHRCIRYAISTM